MTTANSSNLLLNDKKNFKTKVWIMLQLEICVLIYAVTVCRNFPPNLTRTPWEM